MSKFNDVNFFKPFIQGTMTTLKVQCHTEAKSHKPFFKGEGKELDFQIASVITLNSASFCGSISLCYPEKVFLGIMSKMLGEEFKELTAELKDGAAELLNIIYGQAKRVLIDQGYKVDMAIPTIIRGEKLKTRTLSKEKTIILPFETENGIFHIEITTEGD
jgi:chemotaxis protein CheX